ncbi:MAG: glycosyltransferase [candidate division Zixibacteria bacterium]|nr:glycosyltransferase [candidate division Zixibacteria bacterium]
MKILYLAHSGSPHTQKWVRHFVQRGDEVHVASLGNAPIEGAILHPLWHPTGTKLDYLINSWSVRRLVRALKPDILHAHYATSYGYLGAGCNFHPFVITAWGSDVLEFPKSALKRKLLHSTLSKADGVTTAGKFLAGATEKLLGNRQKVILTPFGVDVETFQPRQKDKHKTIVIGTTKSLEPVYGLEFLLRAFARLARNNIKILLVGDGSLRQKLKELAFELKIAEKVEFAGNAVHAEIPGYLQKVDILVNPSLRESFGVSVLEAQACEIPVIASDIGGLPEVVQDGVTGFLVPPTDVNALAEKIELLVSDESLRKRMGKGGREFVKKNYDWSENAKIMERLYDSLVKK